MLQISSSFPTREADGFSYFGWKCGDVELTKRAFKYDVRCFGGIFDLPTLIRYFTTLTYLVKSDAAWPTYLKIRHHMWMLPKFNSYFRETQIDPKWKETFVLSCRRPRTLPPSITTWSKASCHPLSRLCLPILLVMCAGKSFSTLGTTCWKQAASFHQELPFMPSMGKSSQIMAGTNNQLFITIAKGTED